MEIKRGDLVAIVLTGDYGKPRPALVLQDNSFSMLPSVTVVPLTSTIRDAVLFRVTLEPAPLTGLRHRSQIMVDKVSTAQRSKIGERIGQVDSSTMDAVNMALIRFLGLSLTP